MAKEKKPSRFAIFSEEPIKGFTYLWVLVDTETGVQYTYSGVDAGMTPLIDREGKPLICEELIRKPE